MAGKKLKGITIQYSGDTTKLEAALATVEKKSRSAKAEMTEVNRALKEAPESVVLWQQKQELLSKALEGTSEKLKLLETSQKQVREQFEKGSIGEDQYRAFERELEKTRAESEKLSKQIKDTDEKINDLGGDTGKVAEDISDLGDSAEKSSDGFTILKGTVANLAADGFEKLMKSAKEAWEEIDSGYDTIIGKTGATGDNLESLQKTADNVFTSLPVQMNNVGDAIGEVNTRYALTGKELESLTSYFIEYSKINNTQVASSVRNVAGVMKAFQEDTANASKVLDVFTDVGQRTGKDINNLESELLSNSATFKELGLDIRQSAELLGQFETNGVDLSTALAGLKKAQQNATAEGKTLTDSLAETIEHIKGAKDGTEALQIATDLFGKKGAAAMTQAIKEQRFSLDDLVAGYDDMRDVVSDTFEATQDAPDKAKVAANKLKLELAKLAEAVLPKIEKFIDKGVKNLPNIEKTVKNIIPLVESVATAYASWKVATTAVDGAKALSEFAKQMKTTGLAAESLNSIIATGTTAGVALLVAGLIDLGHEMKKAHDEYVPMAQRIDKEVSDAFKEQEEAIQAVGESLESTKDSFKDAAIEADAEADRVQDLWAELQRLADENGNVKDSEKKRAEYILGELSDALGQEYTMTGNQIENYQTMQGEIDKLIQKKQALAYIEAYQSSSGTMAQNKADVYSQYLDAYANEQAAQEEFDKLAKERYGRTFNNSEWQQLMTETYDENVVWNTIDARMSELAEKILKNQDAKRSLQSQYGEIMEYFERLSDAEKAYSEEKYSEVEKRLYYQKNADKEALEGAKSNSEEFEKAYADSLKKIQASFALARSTNAKLAQSDVDNLLSLLTETAETAMKKGKKVTDVFTKEFTSEIQRYIDQGYDVSKLAEWGKESGVDVAEIFGDNYYNVVQSQIDAGYDTTDIIAWGKKCGLDVGDGTADSFREQYQKALNTGFDYSQMREQAASEVEQIFEQVKKNLEANASSVVQGLGNIAGIFGGNKKIKAYAKGGFIPPNGEGIIAEAGPELIKLINGGVQVIPLTNTATNTSVGAGGDTIINNYYTTVNAEVHDNYDINNLAEDLASAEKRIREGQGL